MVQHCGSCRRWMCLFATRGPALHGGRCWSFATISTSIGLPAGHVHWATRWALLTASLGMSQLFWHARSLNEVAQNGLKTLLWRGVTLPLFIWLLIYFCGFGLQSKSLWFDGICVDQSNLPLMTKTMQAIPAFASEATNMLVVWHESLFSKLWCVYEIAVRAKTCSFDSIHVVPVWLPIFVLMSIVVNVFPAFGLSLGFAYPSLSTDPATRFVSLFLYLGSFDIRSYFYGASFAIPITYFCMLKIESHKTMLDQMASFDLRKATCSLETDRLMIRRQVVELFDEALEYPLSVSFEAEESSVSDTEVNSDVAALISPEDLHSFRHVTSYPTEEQIIDEFNAYVRGPLRESVVRSLGREDQIPLKLCVCAFWPSSAGGLAWALGCEGHSNCQDAASNLKFDSVALYLITQAIIAVVIWTLCSLLTLPLVLRANRLVLNMVTGPRLQFAAGLFCTTLILLLWWNLFASFLSATILVGASEVSPLWLSGALAGFVFQCWMLWYFFLRSQEDHTSSRHLARGW
ncbi:unnamed protein product [Durusdinium trenchii]|uniref:Uncharacterized protein n=2 Tax=Durusdinium trenchii TaxID=1381693 RepID=A0ABP0JBF8_9DINO